jgi:hypothetical protein
MNHQKYRKGCDLPMAMLAPLVAEIIPTEPFAYRSVGEVMEDLASRREEDIGQA